MEETSIVGNRDDRPEQPERVLENYKESQLESVLRQDQAAHYLHKIASRRSTFPDFGKMTSINRLPSKIDRHWLRTTV